MKKIIAMVGLVTMLAFSASAASRYVNIISFTTNLWFNGKTAVCEVDVTAQKSIELLVYLKDSDGLVLEDWDCSDAGGSISFSESCPGMQSGERYTLTATARSGGESVTKTSTATCP